MCTTLVHHRTTNTSCSTSAANTLTKERFVGEPPLAPLDEHVVLLDLEDGVKRIPLDAVLGQEVLLQLGVCLALQLRSQ